MANSEKYFMGVYVTVWATTMTAEQEVDAGDRTSDLPIQKEGVLTTRPTTNYEVYNFNND